MCLQKTSLTTDQVFQYNNPQHLSSLFFKQCSEHHGCQDIKAEQVLKGNTCIAIKWFMNMRTEYGMQTKKEQFSSLTITDLSK